MARKKHPVLGPGPSLPEEQPSDASRAPAPLAPDGAAAVAPPMNQAHPVFRPKPPAAGAPPRSPKRPASNFMVLHPGPGQAPAPAFAAAGPSGAAAAALPAAARPRAPSPPLPSFGSESTATATASGGRRSASLEEEAKDTGASLDPSDPDWAARHKKRAQPAARRQAPIILGPIPGAPPNERRANRAWRSHLNGDLLKAVLANVKRKLGHTKTFPFLTKVPPELAPDYHEFVRPEDEMWLHQVGDKLRRGMYAGRAPFLADFEAIAANCARYNTPGAGRFGGPALVPWAEEMVAIARAELEASAAALERAERAIEDPDCSPPFKEEERGERFVPSAARFVLQPQVPLPAGFRHTVRMTSSKPAGWVQYEAVCPLHHCVRTADRVAKLVDIFRSHAQCRPEWREFAQRPGEDPIAYQDRLRETFTFQKGPLPPGACLPQPQLQPARRSPPREAPPAQPPAPQAQAGQAAPLQSPPAAGQDRFVVSFRPQPDASFKVSFRPVQPQPQAQAQAPVAAAAGPVAAAASAAASAAAAAAAQPQQQLPAAWQPRNGTGGGDATAAGADALSRKRREAAAPEAPSGKRLAVEAPLDARRLLQLEAEQYRREASGATLASEQQQQQQQQLLPGASSRRASPQPQPLALVPANGHAPAESETAVHKGSATASDSASGAASPEPAAAELAPEWDGRGCFPRPREQAFLCARFASAAPAPPLLLSGPPGCGKTTLLEQAHAWWQEQERHAAAAAAEAGPAGARCPAPWLQFDCRTAAASAGHFAACLQSAVAEFAHRHVSGGGAALPPVRDGSHLSYVQAEAWAPAADAPPQLARVLDSLAHWWPALQAQAATSSGSSRPPAALVLDSAEVLRGADWAPQLLRGLEQFARQGVRVLLASADCTLRAWLASAGVSVEAETLGCLPPAAARAFLAGLLAAQPAAIDLAADWPEIRLVCGGSPGLLRRCHQGALAYGSLQPALRAIWQEAGAAVRRGLEPPQAGTGSAHGTEHYCAAVSAILRSPHAAASATELENQLGSRAVASLAAAGLLLLREPSALATDLPPDAHGPLQDAVAALPSAAHAYFWSLLSKAGGDALACGFRC